MTAETSSLLIGLKVLNCREKNMMQLSTTLKSMRANNYPPGDKKAGFLSMTLGAGSSGTADTIWVGEYQMKISDRSGDGR